jgi:hypothetical protein
MEREYTPIPLLRKQDKKRGCSDESLLSVSQIRNQLLADSENNKINECGNANDAIVWRMARERRS